MNGLGLLLQGDGVTRSVALLLLLMSVGSWVVILWKARLLYRAGRSVSRSTAAFWQSPTLTQAAERLAAFDADALVSPLLQATQLPPGGSLAAAGERSQQLTRLLRVALQGVVARLQFGQVWLATVGSTAPFVGLLGTVWGIYHALLGMSDPGQLSLDRIAAPVGEALVMTAAGLAVAIPAVLAYNVQGRAVARIEAELEGFARDLRDLLASQVPAGSQADTLADTSTGSPA